MTSASKMPFRLGNCRSVSDHALSVAYVRFRTSTAESCQSAPGPLSPGADAAVDCSASDWPARVREAAGGAEEQPTLEALLQQTPLPRAQPHRALLLQAEAPPPRRTRYDKLAANFLTMVQLASMRLWLRAYESTA